MSDSRITFVCWRWENPVGYRTVFEPSTVYALREMLQRHYTKPHRFVCVTDKPRELKGVETIQLWDEGRNIPSPFGNHNPSCYVRLKVFAPDAGKIFGERLVSIDLDVVIVKNIESLFEGGEDFRIWGESDAKKQWYNGSLWMLKTGTRTQVWTQFDPERSPERAKQAGCFGSDQGWISYILGPKEATWGRKDGLYSFRKHVAQYGEHYLPRDAKMIIFHGKKNPGAIPLSITLGLKSTTRKRCRRDDVQYLH